MLEDNWRLKENYNIQELPTLLLVDQEGEVISHFSYMPLDAKAFASTILETYLNYEEVKQSVENSDFASLSAEELKKLYVKAKKLESTTFREKLLEAGLNKEKPTFFLLEKYAGLLVNGKKKDQEAVELRKKIVDLDPKNTQGSHLQLALLDFQGKQNTSKKMNIKSTIEPLLSYIQEFGKTDRENVWKVELMIAQHLFSKGFLSRALHHAEASYNCAPETAKAEIAQSIDYLKAQEISNQ